MVRGGRGRGKYGGRRNYQPASKTRAQTTSRPVVTTTSHYQKYGRGGPKGDSRSDYDYDILVPRVFSDKKDSIEDDEELNLDDCEINLYPKTYLRGSKTTITRQINSSVTDLSLHSFDDMLKSLEVKGSCCWSIFADKHFRGPHKQFRTGQYKSSTMIGADLVGEASSLKITVC